MSNQENITFETALKRFKNANKTAMTYARMCAEMGLAHFYKSGDLVYCQQFLDAMEQNWNRRVAYLRWLVDFAPIVMEDNILKKDKRPEAMKMTDETLAEAKAVAFWEYLPEVAPTSFGIDTIDARIRSVLKSFSSDRMKAKDPETEKYLEELTLTLDTKVLKTPRPEPKKRNAALSPAVH